MLILQYCELKEQQHRFDGKDIARRYDMSMVPTSDLAARHKIMPQPNETQRPTGQKSAGRRKVKSGTSGVIICTMTPQVPMFNLLLGDLDM